MYSSFVFYLPEDYRPKDRKDLGRPLKRLLDV
jgi:hypothetical protein